MLRVNRDSEQQTSSPEFPHLCQELSHLPSYVVFPTPSASLPLAPEKPHLTPALHKNKAETSLMPRKISPSVAFGSRYASPTGFTHHQNTRKAPFGPIPKALTGPRPSCAPFSRALSGGSKRKRPEKPHLWNHCTFRPVPEPAHVLSRTRSPSLPNLITAESRGSSPSLP